MISAFVVMLMNAAAAKVKPWTKEDGNDVRESNTSFGPNKELVDPRPRESMLTVLAGATQDIPKQISCWLQWMSDMTAADGICEYQLHMVLRPKKTSVATLTTHRFKLDYIESTLSRLPDGAPLIFSDLDVLPIRPYSLLLEAKDASGHSVLRRDAVFMREPSGSKMGFLNSGFFLMRNSPAVRSLVVAWRAALRKDQGDQLALNRVLQRNGDSINASRHSNVDSIYTGIDWHVFERMTVAGLITSVHSHRTVAYHAIMHHARQIKGRETVGCVENDE